MMEKGTKSTSQSEQRDRHESFTQRSTIYQQPQMMNMHVYALSKAFPSFAAFSLRVPLS